LYCKIVTNILIRYVLCTTEVIVIVPFSKSGAKVFRVKPVYNDHPWDSKKWPLLTGGRCSGVIYTKEV